MQFLVTNLGCKHCKDRIIDTLKGLGIKKINVDLESKIVNVSDEACFIDIKEALYENNYEAILI